MTGTDCGLFTHKSLPVIFESPCTYTIRAVQHNNISGGTQNIY
jgi:hypothetical protein